MLQGFGVADSSLRKQFLKFPAVVEGALHLRHEFVGDIDRQSTAFDSDVEHIAGVPFTVHARFAVFTDAWATTEAERSHGGRPEAGSLVLEPLLDFCREFFGISHSVCMPHGLRTIKTFRTDGVLSIRYEFRDRN